MRNVSSVSKNEHFNWIEVHKWTNESFAGSIQWTEWLVYESDWFVNLADWRLSVNNHLKGMSLIHPHVISNVYVFCFLLRKNVGNVIKTVWSTEERNMCHFGTKWGWVNDDRILFFGRTIPFNFGLFHTQSYDFKRTGIWHISYCIWNISMMLSQC